MEENVNVKKSKGKAYNVLFIWEILSKGNFISKTKLASYLDVSNFAVQRCIRDINMYLDDIGSDKRVIYKHINKGYILGDFEDNTLFRKQILIICKSLIESHSLKKEELEAIITKMLSLMEKNDAKIVRDFIDFDMQSYIEPTHRKDLLDSMWKLLQFIQKKEIINFNHIEEDSTIKNYTVRPVSVLTSEQYYYLVAFPEDNDINEGIIVFRVDKIYEIEGIKENFGEVPYERNFSKEEFKKQLQFMQSGQLEEVELKFYGNTPEVILDRMPSAKVIKEEDNSYTITAEVYTEGIINWLLSQGNNIKVIKPYALKDKVIKQLQSALELYS